MALNSIRNIRGFFSDYWLGSILSANKGAGSKLTKAQADKALWRLTQLRNRIEGFENPDPATALAGQKLLREWGTWFNAHVEHIRNL